MRLSIYLALLFALFSACRTSTTLSAQEQGDAEFQQYVEQKLLKWKDKAAPDFRLPDVEGKPLRLFDQKGKLVLLNFWFVDCKPCVTETVSLKELHKTYADQGLRIIAIALDSSDRLRPFIQQYQLPYAVLPKGKALADYYGVVTYPTSFLLDKQGVIREIFVGASDWDGTQTFFEMKPSIEKWLR